MPWLRSRTERSSGITTWAIEWREGGRGGKVRHRVLGAITEKEAQFELAAMQAGKTTRREKRTVEAQKAVDDYLRHLKASGRRDGTIEHDGDKLQPLVDAWAGTPLAQWSRTMLESFLTEREWAAYRVRNSLGVYRRFATWCSAVGIVCNDFVAGIKPPRARATEEREALSAEQCRKLLDVARPRAVADQHVGIITRRVVPPLPIGAPAAEGGPRDTAPITCIAHVFVGFRAHADLRTRDRATARAVAPDP